MIIQTAPAGKPHLAVMMHEHTALSGQFALEQTYIVPTHALLAPEKSPLRVLEALCGRSLAD